MKAVLLLVLVITVITFLLLAGSQDNKAESIPVTGSPFGFTLQECNGCADGSMDWQDTQRWEAAGTFGNGRTFIWVSPYWAKTGVRHVAFTVSGIGVFSAIGDLGTQRSLGPGDMCMAYTQRAFVVIRAINHVTVSYEDGPSNGCLP